MILSKVGDVGKGWGQQNISNYSKEVWILF